MQDSNLIDKCLLKLVELQFELGIVRDTAIVVSDLNDAFRQLCKQHNNVADFFLNFQRSLKDCNC